MTHATDREKRQDKRFDRKKCVESRRVNEESNINALSLYIPFISLLEDNLFREFVDIIQSI